MRRLYYLSEDLDGTRRIADDLHRAGISDWHFRVLCKDPRGLYQHHIHSANPLQRLDIVHSAEQGALIGTGFGLLLASALWLLDSPSYPIDLKMFALMVCICCLLGFWIGAGGGLSHRNYKLARFQAQIEAGQYLLIIDVKKSQAAAIKAVMAHHSHALMAGEGSTFSNPFKQREPLQR